MYRPLCLRGAIRPQGQFPVQRVRIGCAFSGAIGLVVKAAVETVGFAEGHMDIGDTFSLTGSIEFFFQLGPRPLAVKQLSSRSGMYGDFSIKGMAERIDVFSGKIAGHILLPPFLPLRPVVSGVSRRRRFPSVTDRAEAVLPKAASRNIPEGRHGHAFALGGTFVLKAHYSFLYGSCEHVAEEDKSFTNQTLCVCLNNICQMLSRPFLCK